MIELPLPGIELQFHLLRHFSRTDAVYLETFVRQSGYSKEEISAQFAFSGSKFYIDFADNPLKLFEIISGCLEKGSFSRSESGIRNIYTFHFDRSNYPDGIGSCNLVPLNELSAEEKGLMRYEKRGHLHMTIISGVQPRPAWEMHMVMIKGITPAITTIFPGTYAPPLPDATLQNKKEYSFNKSFWENHGLIVLQQ